jgi:tripartite-type tricarboxylate transporter receptor subunit TctC
MAGRRGRVASSSWRRSDPELCHFNERFLPRWRKLAAFFGCETDVPTIAEAGVPEYVVMAWQRLVAPAGLPAPIVSRLNAEVVSTLKEPAVIERLRALGNDPRPTSPEQFKARMAADIAKGTAVVESANFERI